ncbi:prolipoprotein diacylglyceryl transferase [Oceanobacillus saliphilus]|uniref:prolipoprotein diacylglyceryl transferase n=1 Tax=Oceanobacillus saliphilus TaxID=2925834 RepID=UPI00201E2D86|nr:prolipoprotein diacylglyceryl transferase [Oceanobacillus saliphilus]
MIYSAPALDRVFLELGPFTIYWYGVIIAFGALIGIYLATRETDRLGLKQDLLIDFIVFAVPIAILCARIYYVIFEWDRYAGGPWWSIFAVWEGGLAIHGAVIGGVLTAMVFSKVRNVSGWQLLDIVAPSLILAQAIGRWGNFMNQEAHGGPISESTYESFHQYLPDFIMNQMTIDGVMYHPTFLYESFWNVLVFFLLILIRKYNPLRGEIILSYAIFYSIGRFFIESMRTDSLYAFGGAIRQAQLISIVLIVLSIILIIYRRKTVTARYNDVPVPEKQKSNKKKKRKKKKK